MATFKPESYLHRLADVEGWPVGVTSYRLQTLYYCKVDNVSPGTVIARATATTAKEAEEAALAKARRRLATTRVIRDPE